MSLNPILLLRQWRHRHPQQNLNNRKTTKNPRLRDLLSQNQFADLRLANQNPVNSSRGFRPQPEYRHRPGYPSLFDRLTPKR